MNLFLKQSKKEVGGSMNILRKNLVNLSIFLISWLLLSIIYNRKKLRLKWDAKVNPELELLQYDIGKSAVFEETIHYILEKNDINKLTLTIKI